LGLSTQQAQQLREMKQSMLTADTSSAARLEAKQKELDALLSVPEAKTGEVKTRMTELASLKADRQFAVFETATKMKASLTADQRAKLYTLKAEQLHETMMMRAPMGEHKVFMGLVE
jgi:Spy/CpxP family protein refolding chaperone